MSEINRNLISRVGVDLDKRAYQVHGIDGFEKVVLAQSMSPGRFFEWCQSLQPSCVVAMESCSGAHHICRRLRPMGLDACILPAYHVGAYRVAGARSKNDATDAAAICEAASRPYLHTVPVKSAVHPGIALSANYRADFSGVAAQVVALTDVQLDDLLEPLGGTR